MISNLTTQNQTLTNIPVSDEYATRPHMCDTCGKRFTLLENLNRHQMIHTDERPYLCHFCKKRFRLAQHLKEHIRIHTGEKPYKCNECGRAFCQISNLKSHQKTHTKIKAYHCDICGKSFRRSFTLKQHRLTHTRGSNMHKNSIREMAFNGPRSAPPPLIDHAPHPSVSRKRSAPDNLDWDHYSKQKMQTNMTNEESTSGLAMLSAIGAQMSRYSPSTITSQSIPTYQPPQSAPLLCNKETPKERYGFPSLTALLSHDDVLTNHTSQSVAPNTGLSLQYYTQQFIGKDQQASVSESRDVMGSNPVNCNSGFLSSLNFLKSFDCTQCSEHFEDQISLRRHTLKAHSRSKPRRDSAYSSHDDKSLPNSPENMKKKDSLKIPKEDFKSIKQERQSDEDSVKTDRDASSVSEKSTKSGGKWKRQLCQGWFSHKKVDAEMTKCLHEDEEPHQCSLVREDTGGLGPGQTHSEEKEAVDSPSELVIDTNMDVEKDVSPQDVSKPAKEAILTKEAKILSNPFSLHPHHYLSHMQQPQQTFGMERMVPIIEWKPVVTGWQDSITGCMYPISATQPSLPIKYSPITPSSNPQSDTSSTAGFQTPYFRFSPSMTRSFSLSSNSEEQNLMPPPNGVSSVPSSDSVIGTEKYSYLNHGLMYNWDPNRMRLLGTSSTPIEPNVLAAK